MLSQVPILRFATELHLGHPAKSPSLLLESLQCSYFRVGEDASAITWKRVIRARWRTATSWATVTEITEMWFLRESNISIPDSQDGPAIRPNASIAPLLGKEGCLWLEPGNRNK